MTDVITHTAVWLNLKAIAKQDWFLSRSVEQRSRWRLLSWFSSCWRRWSSINSICASERGCSRSSRHFFVAAAVKRDRNGDVWTEEDPVSLGHLWKPWEVKGHTRSQSLGQKIGASAGATVRSTNDKKKLLLGVSTSLPFTNTILNL